MILSCNNLAKSFDDNLIFNNCSFVIEEQEKVAIVGINGAGKSTLLKIIMKELSADEGNVFIAKDKTIGYLSQYQDISSNNTIYTEMLEAKKEIIDTEKQIRALELSMKSASGEELDSMLSTYNRLTYSFELNNGYAYESEIIGVLKGLGFDDTFFERTISTLSGGQKTRVALAKMLLSKPDLILLDEPTNHLDITSITWLESYLSNYNGSVVIVAHDRYFLDKIVTKVVEIDRTKVISFSGNYSDYATKKKALYESEMKAFQNQQREIKHQEEVIEKLRSFNREKSIKRAESREKLLNKIDVLDKPLGDNKTMKFKLEPKIESANDVLTVEDISKTYDNHTLFKDLSFEVKKGERVAIIGQNGTGKTTILKIINNVIKPDSGEVTLGVKVNIGYYDQEHHVLNVNKTIFQEISDTYPTLTNTEIRNMLAAFLFTGDDVFKLISDLSGGERGRLSLAKLMLSEANFIILDEPTNHLDMASKEILEQALNNYTGTILFVSHDRYFINKTATRILDLEDGLIVNYIGNYDYYLEKHDALSALAKSQNSTTAIVSDTENNLETGAEAKTDWLTMKAEQAKERKRKNDIEKTESEIAKLEDELRELDLEMEKPEVATSVSSCMEIHKRQTEINERLSTLYENWEELMI